MFKINCDKCGEELVEPGALIFSSFCLSVIKVNKYHICRACERKLNKWLSDKGK